MQSTASIRIDLPIADVFRFVTTIENMPRWMMGVKSARLVSAEMAEGAHFVLDYIRGWRPYEMELEVVEFQPPTLLAIRTAKGQFAFEGRMELATVDGETEVTNIIEAGPDSLSSSIASVLLGPILSRSFAKRLLAELEGLRRAIRGESLPQ
ncbi:MAG TPA: SRPBCC family protein [Acidimicrobiia bacterium]